MTRSPQVTKAIRHAIHEARLAYAFRAGHYTMAALNAVLAVEQVYLRETMSGRHTSTDDMPDAHDGGDQHDTASHRESGNDEEGVVR
jgi:hypothetical protein